MTILFRLGVQQDGATILRRQNDLASKSCCAAKLTKGSDKEKIENCIMCLVDDLRRHRHQGPECPDFGIFLTETAEVKFKLKAGAIDTRWNCHEGTKEIRHPIVVPLPCDLGGSQRVYATSFRNSRHHGLCILRTVCAFLDAGLERGQDYVQLVFPPRSQACTNDQIRNPSEAFGRILRKCHSLKSKRVSKRGLSAAAPFSKTSLCHCM